MFHHNHWKRTLTIVASVLLLGVLSGGLALAQNKGGGGGGGGGDTGGGTIYFEFPSYLLSTMSSDGSGKAPLPTAPGAVGEPSHALHGGHRWFLELRDIPGETYPSSPLAFDNTRRELFAFRDDGNEQLTVQLTNQPDLQADGVSRWAYDPVFQIADGVVSWVARRWDLVTGQVVDGGIYAAEVVFDPISGNVVGLSRQPLDPLVPLALAPYDEGSSYYSGDLAPDIGSHDWAPDGLEIVHDRFTAEELWVADAVSGVTVLMLPTDHANSPVWSPDGTRIAFNSSDGIDTVDPNGGNRKTIIKWGPPYAVFSPKWSPTGSHLVYQWWNRSLASPVYDIYRATAGGGGRTNLTKDIEGFPFAIGWR